MSGPAARLSEWIERQWCRDALSLKVPFSGAAIALEPNDECQVAAPLPAGGARARVYTYRVAQWSEDGHSISLLLLGPFDLDIAMGDACPACGAPMIQCRQPARELRGGLVGPPRTERIPVGPPIWSCGNPDHWTPASVGR